MDVLAHLARLVINAVLIAAAFWGVFQGLDSITDLIDRWRDSEPAHPIDPADAAVWDVLAAARRITEEAAA